MMENSNKNAKIGFVIFYPFHYYVYKNVYKHLKADAEFIVDLGAFYPTEQEESLTNEIVELLKKEQANFSILEYTAYRQNQIGRYLERYDLLVSVWKRGCIIHPAASDKRKVHMTYGVGKDLVTYSVGKRLYDLILAYGKRDYDIFSLYTTAEIVGNPKFDDWFNKSWDEKLLQSVSRRLDPTKKTILYLPTHGDLSSIDDLSDELKRISPLFNTLVKFHYYTPREEPWRLEKLEDPNVMTFKDDVDLTALLYLADVVISDNSSAIFDSILADKPLVLADFLSKDFLDIEHKKPKYFRRGMANILTYSGSIEQIIKRKNFVPTIQVPGQLLHGIQTALQDNSYYKTERKKLRDWLFGFQDGDSGKRAAEAILRFRTIPLPERPLLYHLLEDRKRFQTKNAAKPVPIVEHIMNIWKSK
jgi:hypothetical protein